MGCDRRPTINDDFTKEFIMRSILAIIFLMTALPVLASDLPLPKIYGKINKESRYVSQTGLNGTTPYRKYKGIVDVTNSESRLGAKGEFKMDGPTLNYVLELGLNSTYYTDTAGRVRVRYAYLAFNDFWGTLTAGQTYVPSAALGLKLDPLSTTSVGLQGQDQAPSYGGDVKSATSDIGYVYRGMKDLISYATPKFWGLQYTLSIDVNDYHDLSNPAGKKVIDYFEHMLTWGKAWDTLKLDFFLGLTTWSDSSRQDTKRWWGGPQLAMGPLTFSAMYTFNKLKNDTGSRDTDTYTMLGATYKQEKHKISLSYGMHDIEHGNKVATNTAGNIYWERQIAAGYFYAMTENFELRATYGNLRVKTDHPTVATASAFDNKANSFALGAQLCF